MNIMEDMRDAAFERLNHGDPMSWRDVGPDEIWELAWEACIEHMNAEHAKEIAAMHQEIDDLHRLINEHSNWHPIATAPKDCRRLLLARISEYGLCGVADGFYNESGIWAWPYIKKEPTHWMELPKIYFTRLSKT